jgi:Family of unknown function (DUF6232)
MTIVYYRGPTALVTDRVFEVWCPGHRRYLISDLYSVQVIEGGPGSLATGSVGFVCSSSALALTAAFIVHTAAAAVACTFVIVTSAAVSGACWRLGRRELQLWGTYGGVLVQLYASLDARTFGQVRRALQRAVEARSLYR